MRPVSIPNTFQTKTGQIPLSQLDSNFTTLATAINDVNTGNAYYVDSSGTPNQIVVTTPSNVTAVYQAGLTISVQVGNTNTATAVTININGQGATNLANVSGTTGVAIGQLNALDIVNLVFDGTSFIVTGGSGFATSTLSMNLSGAFTIPPPTAGYSLTVQALSGYNTIVAQGGSGVGSSVIATSSGAAITTMGPTIAAIMSTLLASNNSGSAFFGIPTGSGGLLTTPGIPLVFAVNGAARLTLGSTAGAQSSYNFAGASGVGSATGGASTALPANPQGYWAIQLNGTNVKIPYYNN